MAGLLKGRKVHKKIDPGTYRAYFSLDRIDSGSFGDYGVFEGTISHEGRDFRVSAVAGVDSAKFTRFVLAINGLTPEEVSADFDLGELEREEGYVLAKISYRKTERKEDENGKIRYEEVTTEYPQVADIMPGIKGADNDSTDGPPF